MLRISIINMEFFFLYLFLSDKTDLKKVSFLFLEYVMFFLEWRYSVVEFQQVIENRRSTREFSIQKVEREKIYQLIESARWSPSAANRQPWKFVIVEGKKKEKIAKIMFQEFESRKESLEDENPTKPYSAARSLINSIRIIQEAPILILVFRKKEEQWLEGDYLSIGSSVEHICLKATDLGLGSLWIRDIIYTNQEIADYVGYQDMELVVSVAIGYSTEFLYSRKRKKIEEIMDWKV